MQAKINPNLNHEYPRFLFSSSCFILINFLLRAQPSLSRVGLVPTRRGRVGAIRYPPLIRDGIVVLATQLFKSLALRLWDEQRCHASQQHDEGVNLQDVVHPGIGILLGSAFSTEGRDGALADDGSDFACCGGDAVGGGSISGGKDFTGDNEGSGIGT